MKTVLLDFFVGKTLIELTEDGFTTDDGKAYYFHHDQECCESVQPVRTRGSVESVLGKPLVVLRENNEEPAEEAGREYNGSYTWTNFCFETADGFAEVCWLGESNGFYGESIVIVEAWPGINPAS